MNALPPSEPRYICGNFVVNIAIQSKMRLVVKDDFLRATLALTNTHFDYKCLAFRRGVQSGNLPWRFGISN